MHVINLVRGTIDISVVQLVLNVALAVESCSFKFPAGDYCVWRSLKIRSLVVSHTTAVLSANPVILLTRSPEDHAREPSSFRTQRQELRLETTSKPKPVLPSRGKPPKRSIISSGPSRARTARNQRP
jgi:hypothetical protein